jgi:glyoxylase-like metal-dependent hydrolase (beta-lactamase superfamily II)
VKRIAPETGVIRAALAVLLLPAIAGRLLAFGSSAVQVQEGGVAKAAIITFVSNHEQERAVRALIRSVREQGGGAHSSPIFVLTTDARELPCASLRQAGVSVLPLEIERTFLDYPLALKAFAAAQVEKMAGTGVDTLIWLDPGVMVLDSLKALDLGKDFDAAVRPVTLANAIGIPPGSEPNDYWQPIYMETGLDHASLPVLTTIADEQQIQPYYNCEVFSFNPRLGLAREWARLLARLLTDDAYQKSACSTFLRKLFLHQAVLSAVISSKIRPERIKPLPLTSGYPFSQHEKLPAAKKSPSLNDVSVAIFDRTWQLNPAWIDKVKIDEPLRGWLLAAYAKYLEIAPQIYRIEGSCNSYLVVSTAGSVLIDPAGTTAAPEYFKLIIGKHPLRAILLTHAHPDHSDGIALWRAGRRIPVVAQRDFNKQADYAAKLDGFFSRKNAIWSGKLPHDLAAAQAPPLEKPGVFFADEYVLKVGGLHFRMMHTPGETPDHATIWIPELEAVFVGDNYYEYFINNSTFRGTMIRPVQEYIAALDTALALHAHRFLPGHGSPIVTANEVRRTVGDFRDALRYIHDETVKGINAGKDVHTLMREISLPEKYALPQFYGKVEWTVRGIWQEYVGWFDENPASMYATPVSDVFADLDEMAGSGTLLQKAEAYLGQGEYPKTLHLTEIILKADPLNRDGNALRIRALKALVSGTSNFIEKIWLNHAIRLCEENLKEKAETDRRR